MVAGRSVVIRGDAHRLPLPDESVDLIVTSPPYYAQRAYVDGGKKYSGQLGAESTWQQYIHGLLDCTEEWIRVLKPSGSIFVNLGDKYSQASNRGYPSKSLLLLPERYRIAAVDRFGLSARAVIVWSKPNGLPESVTDRVRRSHEDWVHLVKQPRYFAAVDEIRESYSEPQRRGVLTWEQRRGRNDQAARYSDQNGHGGTAGMERSPLGKLPGSVWSIPTEPLTVPDSIGVDHFAAFPMEWPRRLILGWSPAGTCTACGEGLRPVTSVIRTNRRPGRHSAYGAGGHGTGAHSLDTVPTATITGYTCACTPYTDHPGTGERHRNGDHPSGGNAGCNINAGTRLGVLGSAKRVGPWREYHLDRWTPPPTQPSVILDPFGGTGTTALVAAELGRIGISVDLSHDYCRLATWRTTDPKQRERVQRKIRERSNAGAKGKVVACAVQTPEP